MCIRDRFIGAVEDTVLAAGDAVPWAKIRVYQAGDFEKDEEMELYASFNEEDEMHLEGEADLNRYTKAVVKIDDAKALENFGKVRVLPGSNYGMIIFDLNEDTVPSGPSLAKHVGSALRRCAEEFGADTTGISTAKDVYGQEN